MYIRALFIHNILLLLVLMALGVQCRLEQDEIDHLIRQQQQQFDKRVPQAGGQAPAPSSSAAAAAPASSGAPAASSGINTAPQPPSTVASHSDALGNLPISSSFGNTVFPGSASFVRPTGSGSVSPIFRLDQRENVTFVWQFESVLVKPVSLTLAAAGPNSVTYTITTLPGGAVSATWNIANVPRESPLMNGYYQIQLYDQRGISASESPGWLSPHTSLTIAFYSGEQYTNATSTSGNDCPLCYYDAASPVKAYSTALVIAIVTSCLFIYGILY